MTMMGFDCLRAPVTVMSPIAHVQEGWGHLGCGSPAGACFLTLARFSGIQYRVAQRHIVQHNSDSYATSFSTTGCFCDYLCPQNTQPGQGPPCSMSKTRSRQWPSCSPLCAEAGEGDCFITSGFGIQVFSPYFSWLYSPTGTVLPIGLQLLFFPCLNRSR